MADGMAAVPADDHPASRVDLAAAPMGGDLVTVPEFSSPGGPLRQSLLRTFEACALSAKWQARGSWPNPLTDLGTVLHAIYAEALRTLQRTGMEQIPTQEMVEIAREVYAKVPIVLPTEQRRDMRWLLWKFCDMRWTPSAIVHVEERLTAGIVGPDGVTRQLTGQPDVLLRGTTRGEAIIVDHKTGQARPPRPRKDTPDEWARDKGRAYLSAQGTFQLDIYGTLVLLLIPIVQRVTLREYHWRWGEVREAWLDRTELEHVLPELGTHLMKLDTALRDGDESPLWRPRPGSHCRYCPRPFECPMPVEERVDGMILTAEDVAAWSEVWVAADALKSRVDKELKAAHDDGLPPARVGDEWLGWDREGPRRRFTLHERVDPPQREAEQAIADDVFARLR